MERYVPFEQVSVVLFEIILFKNALRICAGVISPSATITGPATVFGATPLTVVAFAPLFAWI